ncbi:xanthine dehydrogenase small subunit [Pigmentiphaga sp.]|uniref:xanthine dehydrogenase small subunit n=1 Tax=Pigmentiphaga sp. TaxID=1977564 RepID=UPI00128E11DA|nr:xanthine dehydrogenase small subunit [Pigmentiphaga sp.]MPS26430.1 xanthine dehydrogenase small subunit [Alcaligenaceae bacterium SAGV5]MPS52239.1 xanthine dehydrogenase small subunit [Alcaligenaceae bacterium SAGV3]MPT58012.1 xanthine dehydrogenase small subunit [Alcaligenaceae bacterium]
MASDPSSPDTPLELRVRPARFWHGRKLVELGGLPPAFTVLEWLREVAGCHAVKEGCAEGDCGACTVAVTDLDEAGNPRVRAINACIQPVAALDGKLLATAGEIGEPDALHPVQAAMVTHHGSQCGFCTPGIVMSLYAMYEGRRLADEAVVGRGDAVRALSGNLCRCTGYRPILDAAQAMCGPDWQGESAEGLRERLAQVAPGPQAWTPGQAADGFDGHARGRFLAPRTLAQLAALRAAHPDSRIVAGATDVGLWVTKQHRALGEMLWIGGVSELAAIGRIGRDALASSRWGRDVPCLEIGAAVTVEDAWRALAPHFPACTDYFDRFASVPVRNSATLVGNVANGSPIGDTAPLLIALGGSVVLHRQGQERVLPVTDFYHGYQKNDLRPGEFIRAVRVPLPGAQVAVRAWKLSKRVEQDISAVAVATALCVEQGRIVAAGVGVGGMAAVSSRAVRTEQALLGLQVDVPAASLRDSPGMRAAWHAMHDEFDPLDDLRASAAYRRQAAANLLLRSCLELARQAPATRLGELAAIQT